MSSKQRRVKRKVALMCKLDKASWYIPRSVRRKYKTGVALMGYHARAVAAATALGHSIGRKYYYPRVSQAFDDQRAEYGINED